MTALFMSSLPLCSSSKNIVSHENSAYPVLGQADLKAGSEGVKLGSLKANRKPIRSKNKANIIGI